MAEEQQGKASAEQPLKGWREIADYCGRDVSTVRRWAAEQQLPVYRVGADGGRGVPVHAFASELEAWLRSDKVRSMIAAEGDRPGGAPAAPDDNSAAGSRRLSTRRMALAGAASLAVVTVVGGVFYWSDRASGPPAEIVDTRDIPEEARELYQRGTWLWNRRTPEGILGAIEALTEALEIYPDHAEAHASLAMTYNLARQYSDMSGWEAYPKAEEHARRAVELAPNYAFGHSVLAFVEFHWLWQVEAELARFERARQLDPDDANNLMWYGNSLTFAGYNDEAVPLLERARELDPTNPTMHIMAAQGMFLSGRGDEGMAMIRELVERDPDHPWTYAMLAKFLFIQGDYAGYLRETARLGDMIGVPRLRARAEAGLAAFAEGGLDAMAQAMLAIDLPRYERGEALAWDVALDYAMAGNWRKAVAYLRISLERHEERLIGVKRYPLFFRIRDRPEFRQLLADVGLPVD